MSAADYDRVAAAILYLCTYNYFQERGPVSVSGPYHTLETGPPNFCFAIASRRRVGKIRGLYGRGKGLNQNNDRFSFRAGPWLRLRWRPGWPIF